MKVEDIYNKALTEYPIKEKLNEKAVGTYDANYPRRKAFEAGAEWMQERMIEKAVKWIKTNWREYINGPDKDGCIAFAHWENDFRRAMEEEV